MDESERERQRESARREGAVGDANERTRLTTSTAGDTLTIPRVHEELMTTLTHSTPLHTPYI